MPSDAFSNFVSIDNLEPVTIADRTSATIAKQKPRVPPAERILPFNGLFGNEPMHVVIVFSDRRQITRANQSIHSRLDDK